MALAAKDIMNADVVCARDTMTLRQLLMLLQTNAITGVPVLDDGDGLVGVVSASDILMMDDAFGDGPAAEFSDFHTHFGPHMLEELEHVDLKSQGDLLVRDIMSKSVIKATVTTPLSELAGIMYNNHIHRVIIVDEGQVTGVVGTMDILRAVMDEKISG